MNRYEQLLELVQARRSVRKFSDRGVSREDLLRLLEAARWAPSGHNRQPWKFLILDDKDELRRLAEAIERGLVEKAKSLPEIARAYVADFLRYATFSRRRRR